MGATGEKRNRNRKNNLELNWWAYITDLVVTVGASTIAHTLADRRGCDLASRIRNVVKALQIFLAQIVQLSGNCNGNQWHIIVVTHHCPRRIDPFLGLICWDWPTYSLGRHWFCSRFKIWLTRQRHTSLHRECSVMHSSSRKHLSPRYTSGRQRLRPAFGCLPTAHTQTPSRQ